MEPWTRGLFGGISTFVFYALFVVFLFGCWFVKTYCSTWTPLIKVPHGHVCIVGKRSSSSASKTKRRIFKQISTASPSSGKDKDTKEEEEEEEGEEEEELDRYTDQSRYVALDPNFHWINILGDQIQSIHWCAFQQREDGATGKIKEVMVHYKSQFVPTKSQRFDFLPVQCYTSNGVKVFVDGNLHYRIQNPLLLVSRVDNLHQRLADILDETIKYQMAKLNHQDLILKPSDLKITSLFSKALKNKFAKIGLICEKIYVQKLEMDSNLKNALERSLAMEENHKLEVIKMKKTKELEEMRMENKLTNETRALEVKAKLASSELALKTAKFKAEEVAFQQEVLKKKAELEICQINAEMEASKARAESQLLLDNKKKEDKAKILLTKTLIEECQFTTQQALEFMLSPDAFQALRKTDKLIYLPSSSKEEGVGCILPWFNPHLQQFSTNNSSPPPPPSSIQ